ncbi:hypothetical protein GJ496_002098 [Pomphorhynchus laevis]|nr:hypothetical protein GJ496_002098 [Pomphorhynchus laevis]
MPDRSVCLMMLACKRKVIKELSECHDIVIPFDDDLYYVKDMSTISDTGDREIPEELYIDDDTRIREYSFQ